MAERSHGGITTGGTEEPLDIANRATEGDSTMQRTVNFAIALLLCLLIAVSNSRNAAAEDSSALFPAGVRNWNWIGLYIFAANKLSDAGVHQLRIIEDFEDASDGLRKGDARKFYISRARLRRDLRKPGIVARNRRLAKHLLASLPAKYEEGFAFLRADGTLAADPDPNVRARLVRDKDSKDAGGGDAD